jgi:murein DD-endopeptidase MepM/ murein hydrolase activator NlpD
VEICVSAALVGKEDAMSRVVKAAAAGLLSVLVILSFLVFTGGSYEAQNQACTPDSVVYQPVTTGSGRTPTFNEPEQVKNAQIIIGIGLARKLSLRDIKIALMVAMQESHLRNLAYGDRDSLGLFQQRPSVRVWGTAEQIMDPVHATNKFYDALVKVRNRDSKSLLDVAVAVQRPNRAAYAQTFGLWDAPATALLAGVSTDAGLAASVALPEAGCGDVLGDVETAVQAALSQVGKPYRWATLATAKPFDAAELMQWAYAQAGVTLPASSAAQLKAGPPVAKPGSGSAAEWQKVLQRGDLLFWSDLLGRTNHVSMYLGNGEMVDAPTMSADVAISKVPWTNTLMKLVGATRPIDNMAASGLHGGWQWPLKSITITSPYGMRFHPVLHVWRLHNGVDFAAPMGTPVYAAHAGVVTFVGPQGGGGNVITIDHGGGIETSYLHLSSFIGTRVGEKVSAGQRIALSGSTGYSTGPHLHLIVRVRGNTTDPIPYLRQFGLVP